MINVGGHCYLQILLCSGTQGKPFQGKRHRNCVGKAELWDQSGSPSRQGIEDSRVNHLPTSLPFVRGGTWFSL